MPFGFGRKQRNVRVAAGGSTWGAATDWTITNGGLTAQRTASLGGFVPLVKGSNSLTSSTLIVTINALSAGTGDVVSLGADIAYSSSPGRDGSGDNGIDWRKDGAITSNASLHTTTASWGVGDVLKMVKTGGNIDFYKNNTLLYSYAAIAASGLTGNVIPFLSCDNSTLFQGTLSTGTWM